VFEACRSAGIDPRMQPIPVAPAMHYHMGGVVTDLWGARRSKACPPAVRARPPARMAPTGLLQTPCSKLWCSLNARRGVCGVQTLREATGATAEAPPEMNELSMIELRKRMHSQVGVVREAQGLAATLDWIDAARGNVGKARPLVGGAPDRSRRTGAAGKPWRPLSQRLPDTAPHTAPSSAVAQTAPRRSSIPPSRKETAA
jgi:L-aspartate oxidase